MRTPFCAKAATISSVCARRARVDEDDVAFDVWIHDADAGETR